MTGQKIRWVNQRLEVPDRVLIPYIEGDGTGPDIWAAAVRVFDGAVARAYGGRRQIVWQEVLAGQKAFEQTGSWLPDATVQAFADHRVGIKGPLTTPVGGGIRSLNVALRQRLDLYVCLRPVRWFPGVPGPVKEPGQVDMVIFRENTEDVYAGYELAAGSPEAKELEEFLRTRFGWQLRSGTALGLKPISAEGSRRLIRAALRFALAGGRRSLTLVHKGNIMKFTEGAFRDWGYELAADEFAARPLDGGPWQSIGRADQAPLIVKDVIADAFLQQILTRPGEYDVIATTNLNGDYISDALAAQVGGIGIAPGGNINYDTGVGIFEATHGTAPRYAGQDKVNPSSLILSGEMMLRHLGWTEAADLIVRAMERTLADKVVTYDFHRLMDGATLVSCSGFGDALLERMD